MAWAEGAASSSTSWHKEGVGGVKGAGHGGGGGVPLGSKAWPAEKRPRQGRLAAPPEVGVGPCLACMGVVPKPSTTQGADVISSRTRVSRARPSPPKELSTSANSCRPGRRACEQGGGVGEGRACKQGVGGCAGVVSGARMQQPAGLHPRLPTACKWFPHTHPPACPPRRPSLPTSHTSPTSLGLIPRRPVAPPRRLLAPPPAHLYTLWRIALFQEPPNPVEQRERVGLDGRILHTRAEWMCGRRAGSAPRCHGCPTSQARPGHLKKQNHGGAPGASQHDAVRPPACCDPLEHSHHRLGRDKPGGKGAKRRRGAEMGRDPKLGKIGGSPRATLLRHRAWASFRPHLSFQDLFTVSPQVKVGEVVRMRAERRDRSGV